MVEQMLSPDGAKKPRILVLDDERVIADTIAIILRESGYDARAVYNSKEAIETASVWQPNLILADIILAAFDRNGIETALEICACLPKCPNLFFTGAIISNDLLEPYRTRGQAFTALAKPIHPEELLAHVGRAVAGGAA